MEESESALGTILKQFEDIKASSSKVSDHVDELTSKITAGELDTDNGLSFLTMKNQLLVSYLTNLIHVILKKCSGEHIARDPTIKRLIELRVILEKIRPIDRKLKYQINKLVKTASCDASAEATSTLALCKASQKFLGASNEMDSSDEDENVDQQKGSRAKDSKSNIYVPPKLAPAYFEESETPNQKRARHVKEVKKLQLSEAMIQDLRDEYLDTPMEISQGNRAQYDISKEDKARQEYEEEYMVRLPISKKEKVRRRQLTTMGRLGDEITRLGGSRTHAAIKSSKRGKHLPARHSKPSKKRKLH